MAPLDASITTVIHDHTIIATENSKYGHAGTHNLNTSKRLSVINFHPLIMNYHTLMPQNPALSL